MPRITATVYTFLLIGFLALAAIGTVSFFGPRLAHGSNVAHDIGIVVKLNANKTFVLQTFSGRKLTFQCNSTRCRMQLAHVQRHLFIKAETDVYYVPGPATMTLLATDVD